ncbi:glycosyltransferase family 4 protein [soil metagenome]
MKVLALASYPVQAAATRYRLEQFVQPLAARGITLTIRPFFDSQLFESLYDRRALPRTAVGLLRAGMLRLGDVFAARKADVILIQREAMIYGPPVIEWLMTRSGPPMVLDLDDATYVPYTSPTYGSLGKVFKWFSKTDDLIRWAQIVTCGNRAIAEYVSRKGTRARLLPTVVDTEVFRPLPRKEAEPGKLVLGWVGTHSTFPYLESIFPALQELALDHRFRLKIVGSGRKEVSIPGVDVENLEWKLDREVKDFQSFDIGLYPIATTLYADAWAAGKSGFKAIQYMAVGVPYVATPVGAIAEIGEIGTTHWCASSNGEWRDALSKLLTDRSQRETMGAAGRGHAIEHFGLAAHADKLAAALREAAGGLNYSRS